jgi:hypothetical protein
MGLLIYLFESHQKAGLYLNGPVSIADKSKGKTVHRATTDVTINTSIFHIKIPNFP